MKQYDVDVDTFALTAMLAAWVVISVAFLVLWWTGVTPSIDRYLDAVFSDGMGAGNQLCAFTSGSPTALAGSTSLEVAP